MDVGSSSTIKTLGVKVQQTGIDEAKAELIDYGTKGEQAATKVGEAFKRTIGSAQGLTAAQQALIEQGVTLDRVLAALNGTKVSAAQVTSQVTDSTRALTLAQAEAIRMNAEFDGKFIESRAVLGAHAEALAMDAAAHRAMALAQEQAIAMNAAFDGKFIESRAIVLAHAEALAMDAAANETLAASTSSLITSVAALAAAFGLYKVGQFSADAVTLAARYQTLGVVMEVVGKNAGDTAGEMADLQTSLQRTGISAIESRQNLIRMTEAHIDLAKASQLARVAQDAAVIGNLNSSDAFARLTQGIQTAQVRVLRTIGINVDFEESYKRLAKEIGTTAAALTDDEKVQARTNAVLERGVDIAGSYAAAMNTAGKEINSTKRYLEDMKVKAGTAFLPEYTELVHSYATALKFLGDNAPLVTGAIAGITAATIALGVAAAVTAVALAPITLPVIAATTALAALGIGVGVFAKQAADGRAAADQFTQSLKHMSDDRLQANLNQINQELRDIFVAVGNGTQTDAEMRRYARLSALQKSYADQLKANRASEDAASAKAAGERDAEETKKERAFRVEIAQRQLEIEGQKRLNDAYGASAAVLERIAAANAALITKQQDEKKNDGDRLSQLNAATDAMLQQKMRAIDLKDAHDQLVSATESLNAKMGVLLGTDAALRAADPAEKFKAWTEQVRRAGEALQQDRREIAALTKGAGEWLKVYDAAEKAAKQYDSDMQTIWREGIGKIATDGFKSFQDFFEDVFQLFSRLMKRMEQEGKDSGFGYQLLGLGSAAVGAGVSGYQIGRASSSQSSGSINGAISGAAAGAAFGPWGIAIGGLVGAANGLLGAAQAQKEAAEAQRKAQEQTYASLLQMNVAAGTSSQRAASVIGAQVAAFDLEDAINKALPGLKNQIEREKELAQVRADEPLIIAKINAAAKEELKQSEMSLEARRLAALGYSDEATALTRHAAQEKELFDAEQAGWDASRIAALQYVQALEEEAVARQKNNDLFFSQADAAWQAVVAARQQAAQAKSDYNDAVGRQASILTNALDAQLSVAQAHLKVAQDTLKTAEQSHADTQRALDSLTQFRASLNAGPLSTLSPIQQVNAARGSVDDLFRAAQLGDKNAAAGFGDAANAYLQQLRGYAASGPQYAAGADDITRMADALVKQYGVQETIDQRMLDSATQQVNLLQQQIDLGQSQLQAIQDATAKLTAVVAQQTAADLQALQDLTAAVGVIGINTAPTAPAGSGGGIVGSIGTLDWKDLFPNGQPNDYGGGQDAAVQMIMGKVANDLQDSLVDFIAQNGGMSQFTESDLGLARDRIRASVLPGDLYNNALAGHLDAAHRSSLFGAYGLSSPEDQFQAFFQKILTNPGFYGGQSWMNGTAGGSLTGDDLKSAAAPTVNALQDISAKSDTSIAVLQSGFLQLLAKVDTLATKVDTTTSEVRRVGQAIAGNTAIKVGF